VYGHSGVAEKVLGSPTSPIPGERLEFDLKSEVEESSERVIKQQKHLDGNIWSHTGINSLETLEGNKGETGGVWGWKQGGTVRRSISRVCRLPNNTPQAER